ncbi:hypothetical protein OAE03_02785 [Winogradskyella sp.]|nr:hypothetical protein [Winogradskyella sp.]MDC0009463.1 hypothetical protein [Winogradskyella sp.]MDC1229940.1 hypothetical protein [bacterium]MDC1505000.1 hypothetical protein [Winogradskyella sp.]
MKNSFTILALCSGFFASAQSPWTQEKGSFYTQLSFTTIASYTDIFGDPNYSTFGDITDNTIQLYGEYGLTNQTSLIVNLPVKVISINNFEDPRIDCGGDCSQDFTETALGNLEIGIKHNFYNNDWLFTGQFSVEANTSTYNSISGIRTGYDAYTFTPLFLAGRSFNKTYLQAFIGANIRTNGYSSNFKIGGEVGYKVTNRIWFAGFVDIVKSLENGDIILPIENTLTALYVNDQDYGVFGLKAIGEITNKIGATASFGGAFFGNNVAQQVALNVGMYHKF